MTKPKKELQIEIPSSIVIDLLTPSELKMVKQRIIIMELLKKGLSVRAIASRVSVGTDTVMRMARKLEESKKLKKYFEVEKKENSTTAKWVFGQVSIEEK